MKKASLSMGYLTFKNKSQAQKICTILLNEKLIACANILAPHTALYNWKGKAVSSKETAAIIKTQKSLEKRVAKRVQELHSYEVACVVFWPLSTPLTPFANWVVDSTR